MIHKRMELVQSSSDRIPPVDYTRARNKSNEWNGSDLQKTLILESGLSFCVCVCVCVCVPSSSCMFHKHAILPSALLDCFCFIPHVWSYIAKCADLRVHCLSHFVTWNVTSNMFWAPVAQWWLVCWGISSSAEEHRRLQALAERKDHESGPNPHRAEKEAGQQPELVVCNRLFAGCMILYDS